MDAQSGRRPGGRGRGGIGSAESPAGGSGPEPGPQPPCKRLSAPCRPWTQRPPDPLPLQRSAGGRRCRWHGAQAGDRGAMQTRSFVPATSDPAPCAGRSPSSPPWPLSPPLTALGCLPPHVSPPLQGQHPQLLIRTPPLASKGHVEIKGPSNPGSRLPSGPAGASSPAHVSFARAFWSYSKSPTPVQVPSHPSLHRGDLQAPARPPPPGRPLSCLRYRRL